MECGFCSEQHWDCTVTTKAFSHASQAEPNPNEWDLLTPLK